jgi:hypothetical protein
VRMIDVGCFQVDLFFHPYAFASLEEAFDPDANARAAARILSMGRFASTGWDGAIAAYHSAVPLVGVTYLQKVRSVWPWARARSMWVGPEVRAAYAALLSPQARLVRVVTPFDASPAQSGGVLPVMPVERPASETVQWLHEPPTNLPRVLTSSRSYAIPSR